MKIISEPSKNLMIVYQRNKAPAQDKPRWFLDKKVVFSLREKRSDLPIIYVYITEISKTYNVQDLDCLMISIGY
jgi:hypothetical protein